MSKIFVTSDLHFGHENIITFANRPFKNVDEMNKILVKRWNSVVMPEDTVYILGDLIHRKYKGDFSELAKSLNGKKFLIIGNHDWVGKYSSDDFVAIYEFLEIKVDEVTYFLSHYPLSSFPNMYKNSVHLYGHVHKASRDFEFPKIPNTYCVNTEFWSYMPVEITRFKPVDFKQKIIEMYGEKDEKSNI